MRDIKNGKIKQKLLLKIAAIGFMITAIFITACSSDDENITSSNFYNLEYRTGLWISLDGLDTLEFVNSSSLIRKGIHYKYEEYLYKLENEILVISDIDSVINTYHSILKAEKDTVVIDNMYIAVGLRENSGIFIKEK